MLGEETHPPADAGKAALASQEHGSHVCVVL